MKVRLGKKKLPTSREQSQEEGGGGFGGGGRCFVWVPYGKPDQKTLSIRARKNGKGGGGNLECPQNGRMALKSTSSRTKGKGVLHPSQDNCWKWGAGRGAVERGGERRKRGETFRKPNMEVKGQRGYCFVSIIAQDCCYKKAGGKGRIHWGGEREWDSSGREKKNR